MSDSYDLVVHAERVLVYGVFREAWIGVLDGTIMAIEDVPIPGPLVELPADQVLIPGLVDTHVHVNEPGRTEWEGFASATRAAAASGVTTIVDMPLNSIPATISVDALNAKKDAAGPKAIVDVGFWGGAVPENLGSLKALWDEGVFGFKSFLAPSGVDEFGHLDATQLRAALEEIAAFDGLLIVHAEDPAVLDAHVADGGTDYHSFVDSRPDEAEQTAIERVIEGVRETGARAHILHLSSAKALPALRAARAEGLPITVETCPHYLTLASESIPNGATQFKCCPPIRDTDNQEELWQALLDGDIDIVVTDHSPSTAELKFSHGGDFQKAWGGIAGLQTGLSAVWTAARFREIPLERVVEWMATKPAKLVGLKTKGELDIGGSADFVAYAPEESFEVHAADLQHRNAVSAFDGRTLYGVAKTVWLRGEVVSVAPDAVASGHLLSR